MSYEVEDRVVEMRFDNSDFERNAATSIKTLNALEESLQFKDATKGLDKVKESMDNLDFGPINVAIETISNKFSVLRVMAVTAISRITNQLMGMAQSWIHALTVTPLSTGWAEYGQQLDSVQVIMANTGATLTETNAALNELNRYADQTSYSFGDMTTAISKFSAAGVNLKDSVAAIKGLSNAAALVGASRSQLYSAYYNLAQSMQQGYMTLIDWKSIANSSIGNKKFRENLIEMAVEMGKFSKESEQAKEAYSDFNGSLQKRWLTKDVMVETLNRYSKTIDDYHKVVNEVTGETEYLDDYGRVVSDTWLKLGESATNAATEIKNLSGMWDVLCESAQTGWADTWKLIIGDLDSSKTIFTGIGHKLSAILEGFAKARNDMMAEWVAANGRKNLIETIFQLIKNIWSYVRPIIEAINEVFPITGKNLADVTLSLKNFTASLYLSEERARALKDILVKILTPLSYVVKAIRVAFMFSRLGIVVLETLFNIIVAIVKNAKDIPIILKEIAQTSGVNKILKVFVAILSGVKNAVVMVGKAFKDAFIALLPELKPLVGSLLDLLSSLLGLAYSLLVVLSHVDFSFIVRGINFVVKALSLLIKGVSYALIAVSEFFDKLSKGFSDKSSGTVKAAKNVGTNVVLGFINGIKENSLINMVMKAVTNLGGIIIETFRTILGIHSPSVVFYALGGFVVAGLVAGIIANFGLISSTMSEAGNAVSNGFLTAIDRIGNSEIFRGIVVAFKTVGNIVLDFLKQLKPVHVIALVIASAIFVLAKAISKLHNVFDGVNEVLEAVAARIKAQAFDTIANGIIKIAASLAVLMSIAMIDPDRFRNAAITIGVLSAALMTLYFVLTRVDAILSTTTGTFKMASKSLASSGFIFAFSSGILMLVGALKILSEMSEEKIWGSIRALMAVMATLGASVMILSTVAPKLRKGAMFLLMFALSTRILVSALKEVRESMVAIEDLQAFIAELVGTMAVMYIMSTTVVSLLSKIITTISKSVANMFFALALAAMSVSVSIVIYATAMRVLNNELMEFTDSAKDCLKSLTMFMGTLSVFMSAVALFALFDSDNRIGKTLLTLAGGVAIITASLMTLVLSIGLLKLMAKDLSDVTPVLMAVTAALGIFGVTMVSLSAILGRRRGKKDKTLEYMEEVLKQFTALIATMAGSLILMSAAFAVINHFGQTAAGIITPILTMIGMFGLIAGLLALAAKITKDNDKGVTASSKFFEKIVGLVSTISGVMITIAALTVMDSSFVRGFAIGMAGITAICGNLAGVLATVSLLAKTPIDKKQIGMLAAVFGFVTTEIVAMTAMAAILAHSDIDMGAAAVLVATMGLVITLITVATAAVGTFMVKSPMAVKSMLAVAGAFVMIALSLSVLTTAATNMVNSLSVLNNMWGDIWGTILLLTALSGLVEGLSISMIMISNMGGYAIAAAALLSAVAVSMTAFMYAVAYMADHGTIAKLGEDLNKFFNAFAYSATKVWALYGTIVLFAAGIFALSLPLTAIILTLGVAAVALGIAALGFSVLARAVGLAAVPITEMNNSLVAAITAMNDYKDVILEVGTVLIEVLSKSAISAVSGLTSAIDSLGNMALKVCGAMWGMILPAIIFSVLSPLLVPLVLAIGIACSTAAIGMSAFALVIYALISNGYDLKYIGQQLYDLTVKLNGAISLLASNAEDIRTIIGLLAALGQAVFVLGIGVAFLGVGIALGAAGIIATLAIMTAAMFIWRDQIVNAITTVKEFLGRVFTDNEFTGQVIEFTENIRTMLVNIGIGLAAVGAAMVLVGIGTDLIAAGLLGSAAGIAGLAGALYLWNKLVTPKHKKLEESLRNAGGALVVLSLGTFVFSLVAPVSTAVALGLLQMAGALAVWNKCVTSNSANINESMRTMGGSLALLSLGILAFGMVSRSAIETAAGIYVLATALGVWDRNVSDSQAAITKSLIAVGLALISFAIETVIPGNLYMSMVKSGMGVMSLALAIGLWNTLIVSNYDAIASSLISIGGALIILADGVLMSAISSAFMIPLAIGITALAGALALWNYTVTGNYPAMALSLAAIGNGIMALGVAVTSVSYAAAPMIAVGLGLAALGLSLWAWDKLVYELIDLSEGMSALGTGITDLALGSMVGGVASPLMIATALGLLALSAPIAIWVSLAPSLPDLSNGMHLLAAAIISIGESASYSASIVGLAGALTLLSLAVGLASVIFTLGAVSFTAFGWALYSTIPLIQQTVEYIELALESAYTAILNVGGALVETTSTLGEIFTNGFVKGISSASGIDAVMTAAANLGQAAVAALAGPDGIDDPVDWSAATRTIGLIFDNGLIKGIRDGFGGIGDAASEAGQTAVDAVGKTALGDSVANAATSGWGKIKGTFANLRDKAIAIFTGKGEGENSLFGLNFDGITEEINKVVEDLKTAFDFDAKDDVFGGLSDSATAAKGTIETLTDTIKNQMKMFEKFDDSTDMSAQELLKNMESQLNGITNWANGIETLGLRGMSAELIQYLAEMGPQGYKYVEAFLDMTQSELASANEMFTESLSLPDRAANTVKSGYEYAGVQIVESVAKGMKSGSSGVGDAADDINDEINDKIEEEGKVASEMTQNNLVVAIDETIDKVHDEDTQKMLRRVQSAIINGWTPDPQELSQAWYICFSDAYKSYLGSQEKITKVMTDSATGDLSKYVTNSWMLAYKNNNAAVQNEMAKGLNLGNLRTDFNTAKWDANSQAKMEQLGKSACMFVVDGITMDASSYATRCRNEGKMLAAQVIGGFDEIMQINSPSRVMMEKAMYTVLGLVKGFDKNTGLAEESGADLGTAITGSLSNTLDAISGVFGTDFEDMTPTITPVMDLSGIEAGVSQLQDLLNGRHNIMDNVTVTSVNKTNADMLNESIAKLNELNSKLNKDLADSIINSDKSVTVNVMLEGDAEGVFKLVQEQNMIATKSQGVSPLMTMYNNGLNARRSTT